MKKFCILMLILALVIVPIASASNSTAFADEGKIIVCGEGEVSLIPDMAIVSVGVESLNESLITAQSENTQSMNALVAILKEMGISDECIKTKGYNVYQRYDYSQGEKLLGYQVSNYLEFKTKDVDNIGSIVSKLMENGANRFSGVSFTLENSEEAYKQALSKAFENAKTKASALYSGELEVVKITEEKNTACYLRDNYGYASSISEATKFMKGEIKISASVTVVFEYDGEFTKETIPEHIEPEIDDQIIDKETGDEEQTDGLDDYTQPNLDEQPDATTTEKDDTIITEDNINEENLDDPNADNDKEKVIVGNKFNHKKIAI